MGTNQKHTPGPWEVRHESADPEWSVVVASGGRIVANVNAETGPDIPPLVATKMPKDANAALISAAPDLLAELQRVTSWVKQFQAAQRSGGDMLQFLQNVATAPLRGLELFHP